MVVEIVKSQMSVEAGAAFLVLGTDPDRKLRGEDTQAIYGEVVKQTKMGANGMWEVKFDNGETHKLAASWIELKLWSKSIEDEENDADDDVDEDPSEQASSKDDNEDQENEE